MGQTLSEPVTTKESSVCQSTDYDVASSAMQGWRISMEDAHTHLLSCPDDEETAFFAVYDGHGGARVAQFAGMHLHKRVIGNEHFSKSHVSMEFFAEKGEIAEALKAGFLALDEDLRNDEETKEQMSGTTAVTVLIRGGKIYCANAGDSRAVLCQQGKAIPLSFDHKPTNELEIQRIVQAGGWVDSGRVNGNLALSRALGDFVFKNSENLKPEDQVVTAYPDVIEVEMQKEHEFIVLACDGIWDVLSNEQVVWFVRSRLAAGDAPQKICEDLLNRCLAPDCELSGVGCDNMSVVLVCLLQGDSAEEFLARVRRTSIVDEQEFGDLYENQAAPKNDAQVEFLQSLQSQIRLQLISQEESDDNAEEEQSQSKGTGEDTEAAGSSTKPANPSAGTDGPLANQTYLTQKDVEAADDCPPSEFKVDVAEQADKKASL